METNNINQLFDRQLKLNEFTKTDSQFTSVTDAKKQLASVVSDFNNNLQRIRLMFKDFNATLRDEKEKAQYQKIQNDHLQQLNTIENDVKTRITRLAASVRGKQYPLMTKDVVAGSLAQNKAVGIFTLSLTQPSIREKYIYDPQRSVAYDEIDFYSQLIDLEESRPNKEKDELTKLADAKKYYYKLIGVSDSIAEMLELNRFLEDVKWQRACIVTPPTNNDLMAEGIAQMRRDAELKTMLNEIK